MAYTYSGRSASKVRMQGAVQGAEVHTPAKVLVRASYTREGSCARVLQWRCVHNTLPFALCCRFDDSVQILILVSRLKLHRVRQPVFITSSTSTPSLLHRVLQRLHYIEYFNTHCDAHIRTHTHTPHLRPHPHPSVRTHTLYDLHLPYTHTCAHANVNSMHSAPPADTGSIHRWCYRKRRFSLQERKPL